MVFLKIKRIKIRNVLIIEKLCYPVDMRKVLIVEDDAVQRTVLSGFLREKMNLSCAIAENGRQAMDVLKDDRKAQNIGLIICDIDMPVMDGMEFLKAHKLSGAHIPVIMLTGNQDINLAVRAMQLGAADFVTKPFDKERMVVTIWNVLKMSRMEREIDRLRHGDTNRMVFRDIIGYDGDLADTVQIAKKCAMTDLPILISGETGTGKELFAKAIHGEGNESGGPFITVNCGAIPSELVESTLFGHEKGAFTGATSKAIGKFREADGGTIFLDEIGELPLSSQVKLLRVLQEGEVEPVGAARPVKVRVRIISATLRDLSQDVQQGQFREDLYYRLNVLRLDLPSLRQRPHDMPQLIEHFLAKIATRANMPIKPIEKQAMHRLVKYQWPGNVRQLENTLNRAVIMGSEPYVSVEDITFDGVQAVSSVSMQSETNGPIRTIAALEQAEMHKAMVRYDQNITKAAEAIGMAKSTFYRKMREYNMPLKR